MGRKENPSIEVKTSDKHLLIWGWVAVILAVAIGVATVQLSTAISTGILILSGFGGASMMILSGGMLLRSE